MICDMFETTYATGISICFICFPTFDNVMNKIVPSIIVIIPVNIDIFRICFLSSKNCSSVIKPGIINMLLYPAYNRLLINHPLLFCFYKLNVYNRCFYCHYSY